MDKQTFTVENSEAEMRFFVREEEEVAILEYRLRDDLIALMHTLVPAKLEGRGLASTLAHHALEWAKEKGRRVVVYCPFVAAYLKGHPEYMPLVVSLHA